MTSVLFVCLGNICRSPLAEGVFRHQVETAGLSDRISIDSAGTGNWHEGDPPDPRSIDTAARHGIDISRQQARQITASDFRDFDLILAMDSSNISRLSARAGQHIDKIRLFLNNPKTDVPDPYYGGEDGFEEVFQMVKSGGASLLDHLAQQLSHSPT